MIFLESDYNPMRDLQAMDRAHRIGQESTVNVYRLVTQDSIEERIIDIQRKKVAVSNAVVNTENSTMFSMSTESMLDIFASRAPSSSDAQYNLESLMENYQDEYESVSVGTFVRSLADESEGK